MAFFKSCFISSDDLGQMIYEFQVERSVSDCKPMSMVLKEGRQEEHGLDRREAPMATRIPFFT